MSHELSGSKEKVITSELIDKIIESFDIAKRNDWNARKFWVSNRSALIGLGITTVISLLRSAQDRADLQECYNRIVVNMTWEERVEFLKGGIDELRKSNSERIREATIIVGLFELLPKVLPLVLAAI